MAIKQENRWAARPRLAMVLRAVIYGTPVVVAMVAAAWTRQWVLDVAPSVGEFGAIGASLVVAIAVVAGGERLGRRMLPLAMLLKMSLLFPDAAPSRLKVALRAASTRRLQARTEDTAADDRGWAEETLTLVAALNAHDRRTRGHSERVRALSMLMADELCLSADERDMLEWASLLHDIGKTTVPPEILNKAGRPDRDEWAILAGHPAAGGELAEPLKEWLGEWTHAIDQHHEKWDGSGYPLGLAGNDIALSGRIVAVTDAFETMTAVRSYKQGMTAQAARDELVACSGKHFDPAMVRAFMSISVGHLHWAMGPASWATSLPFGSLAPKLAGLGSAAMGGVAVPVVMGGSLAILAPAAMASTGVGPWNTTPAVTTVDGTSDLVTDGAGTQFADDDAEGDAVDDDGRDAGGRDDADNERVQNEDRGDEDEADQSDGEERAEDSPELLDSGNGTSGDGGSSRSGGPGLVDGTVDGLTDTTDQVLGDVDDLVGDTLGSVGSTVGGVTSGLPGGGAVGETVDGAVGAADEVVGGVTETVGGVTDDLNETLDPVTDGVDDVIGGLGGALGGGTGGSGGGGGLLGLGR